MMEGMDTRSPEQTGTPAAQGRRGMEGAQPLDKRTSRAAFPLVRTSSAATTVVVIPAVLVIRPSFALRGNVRRRRVVVFSKWMLARRGLRSPLRFTVSLGRRTIR